MSELQDAIQTLNKAVEGTLALAERVKRSGNIVAVGQMFKLLHEEHKNLETLTDMLGSIKTEYSRHVAPYLFDSSGVPKINVGDKALSRGTRLHASIPQHKLDKGLAWLRKEGYESIIKEGVHAKTLSSAINAYVEDKGMLPPDDAISIHIEDVITIRKG